MSELRNSACRVLDRNSCALVIIDPQTKLMPAIFEADRVINNCVLLLRLAQVLSIPAVVTTQYAQGLGPLVSRSGLRRVRESLRWTKPALAVLAMRISSITSRKLGRGRDTLLVAGVESHVCVTQTVLAALNAGYTVHVARDATSSRTQENWEAGLHRMDRAGAVLSSTEMMIYELLGKSGTPEFKAMLPLLK